MITQQELNALIQICNRIPLSQAEALWLQSLLNRLQDTIVAEQTQKAATQQEQDAE